MEEKIICCEECKFEENCPVQWHLHNAACLTIQMKKEKDESD